jgi:8-oxo-dGTP diphosphatase
VKISTERRVYLKTIEVAAALIFQDGKLLAAQRGYGDYKGWWEFPGGKLEPNENAKQALIRELKEEMNCEIEVDSYFDDIEFDYPKFHLHMFCFLCHLKENEQIHVLEHDSIAWLNKEQLNDVMWLEADLSILEKLKNYDPDPFRA